MTDTPNEVEARRGRPTAYAPELGEMICGLLAEGNTLSSICKEQH